MNSYHVPVVKEPSPIEVAVPGSKSITNRALLIGALAEGTTTLKGILYSDDSRHFLQSLKDLGFAVEDDERTCIAKIGGLGGKLPGNAGSINVGSAGTAARFLTAFLGLSEGEYFIDSSEQMKKRPMKELLDALRALGAQVSFTEQEEHFPLTIGNPAITQNEVTVDVDRSSQFLSALLISSVLFKDGLTIHVTGSHGMAYVDMTVRMMEQFGVHTESFSDGIHTINYRIPANSSYKALDYDVEPDVSAACYFYAMGAVLGVPALVRGVHREGLQGDTAFLQVLCDMGCSITEAEEGVRLLPPAGLIKGGTFDLSAFSDQTLTLAAIAPFASSPVTITGVSHIRLQECDRINAILTNLQAMGIACGEADGTITIQQGTPHGASIQTYEDHRVAMSFTIPGLLTEGIVIENPMCCRKTFEGYYDAIWDGVIANKGVPNGLEGMK